MVLLFRLIANVDFRRTSLRSVTGPVLIVPSLGNGPRRRREASYW
jgi:hypothetical protein